MASIALTRTIFADPTSAALLLASSSSLGPHFADLSMEVRRPSRTGTAFVSRVLVTRAGARAASGLLTLSRGTPDRGPARTVAVLRLDHAPDLPGGETVGSTVESLADFLLTTIATMAEDRAFAA